MGEREKIDHDVTPHHAMSNRMNPEMNATTARCSQGNETHDTSRHVT